MPIDVPAAPKSIEMHSSMPISFGSHSRSIASPWSSMKSVIDSSVGEGSVVEYTSISAWMASSCTMRSTRIISWIW